MKSFSSLRFAIVGATGNVGLEFLKILQEKNVPAENIAAVASSLSEGLQLPYGYDSLRVHNLETFDFSSYDIGLFSPGGAISAIYAPKAEEQGCLVIDNTSRFRMEKDIALVIPEINKEDLKIMKRRIIANPNCSTIQLIMALFPIDSVSPIQKVVVSTYQSVSGAGKGAIEELKKQINGSKEMKVFNKTIAYNIIAQIDVWHDDGSTKEEWKMVVETEKIMKKSFPLFATCVRVPVFCGHSESVYFELKHDVPLSDLYNALSHFPGLCVVDPEQRDFWTPIEIAGRNEVFVSRLRKDPNHPRSYQMWVVSDNIRKGAALNAVQIAESYVNED